MKKSFLKKAAVAVSLAFGIAVPSYAASGIYIEGGDNHFFVNNELYVVFANMAADVESNIGSEAKSDNWMSGVDWHVISRDTVSRTALISTVDYLVNNHSGKTFSAKEISYIFLTRVASSFIFTAAQEFGQNYLQYRGVPEQPAKWISFAISHVGLSALTVWGVPYVQRAIAKDALQHHRGLKSEWVPVPFSFKQHVETIMSGNYIDILGAYDLKYRSNVEVTDENNNQFEYVLSFSRYYKQGNNIEVCVQYKHSKLPNYCTQMSAPLKY